MSGNEHVTDEFTLICHGRIGRLCGLLDYVGKRAHYALYKHMVLND